MRTLLVAVACNNALRKMTHGWINHTPSVIVLRERNLLESPPLLDDIIVERRNPKVSSCTLDKDEWWVKLRKRRGGCGGRLPFYILYKSYSTTNGANLYRY
mmetsp:Transcript_41819/g.97952  ORF Transcript_41819/g.97952 Transcript_41819/m.97952 type:complete len:101 (+) Transcript_41819:94-396(+)